MDEPTSVLTLQEIGVLFATLRRLVSEGCSILYISHKLRRSARHATAPPSCAAARWWGAAIPSARPHAAWPR